MWACVYVRVCVCVCEYEGAAERGRQEKWGDHVSVSACTNVSVSVCESRQHES